MFEELVISGKTKPTYKRWTVVVSILLQAGILGGSLLIPLWFLETLPKSMLSTYLVAPPPPPPPSPPASTVVVRRRIPRIQVNTFVAPTLIPKKIVVIRDELPPDVGGAGVVGGVSGGEVGGVLGGIIGPPPPPIPPPLPPNRIRIGGNVIAAKLKYQVVPEYSALAKTARISGTVTLHAIIAKDGTIQELSYVSGPALLMHSAQDAVIKWRYEPTYLNGQPVEVDTLIQVVFHLQ